MALLSVTVITRNEAEHIEACLASVDWADERLVVDCGSTDDTVALARRAGARVIETTWPGYAAQKNVAAEAAQHDWILSIDADERVTPDLAREIRDLLARQPSPPTTGYRIPRITWHLGRWLKTTDWYPDPQLRLYDRRHGRWTSRRVHESVEVDGAVGRLTRHLEHFAYRDLAHHVDTINRYTTLAAQEMYETGRPARAADLLVHPIAAFLRNYVLKRGALDGSAGLTVSLMNAYYVFLKMAKLRELERDRRGLSRPS